MLLGYPDEALAAQLPVLAAEVDLLPDPAAAPLRTFLTHAGETPTLDLRPALRRDVRPQAALLPLPHLLRPRRHPQARDGAAASSRPPTGLPVSSSARDELPDHLAVVLEFAGTDPRGGRQLLLDHRAGIELLRLALEDARSPYVDVLRAVTSTLPALAGDEREAVHRLAVAGPADRGGRPGSVRAAGGDAGVAAVPHPPAVRPH